MNRIETFIIVTVFNQEMLYSVFELPMYIIVGPQSPIITDNLVSFYLKRKFSPERFTSMFLHKIFILLYFRCWALVIKISNSTPKFLSQQNRLHDSMVDLNSLRNTACLPELVIRRDQAFFFSGRAKFRNSGRQKIDVHNKNMAFVFQENFERPFETNVSRLVTVNCTHMRQVQLDFGLVCLKCRTKLQSVMTLNGDRCQVRFLSLLPSSHRAVSSQLNSTK